MDLSTMSYQELVNIAKLNNLYIPPNYNRKNLENYIYKNLNLKSVVYHMIVYINIENYQIEYTKNLLQYIDDNIELIPGLIFGSSFWDDKIKKLYFQKDSHSFEFNNFDIFRTHNDVLQISFYKNYPFADFEKDAIEKIFEYNTCILEEEDFFCLKEKDLIKYNLPENFCFGFSFNGVIQVAI
jgi:hypothetical protein